MWTQLAPAAASFEIAKAKPVAGSRAVYFPAPHGRVKAQVWQRASLPSGWTLTGPAIIEEYSATTVLLPGDQARVGTLGEIIIDCGS